VTSRSMTSATGGTSKPRLGTTWDDFRRPRPPLWHINRSPPSCSHGIKQSKESGTFQPRSRTFPNVPNVPKTSRGVPRRISRGSGYWPANCIAVRRSVQPETLQWCSMTSYRRLETSQSVAGSSRVRRVTQNVWAPDVTVTP
jgi:hypothetical protein